MNASMRFNFEPETMRDPSGVIKISDRIYRKRQGRRMVFMGLLFIGLVIGLSSQGDGGYFHDMFAAESTPLMVVGVFFLIFTVLTTYMGVMQLATNLILTLNSDLTEVRFDQTRFGRNVLSATVPVEELDPDVREAIEELVKVLRLSEPEELEAPESEPLYQGKVPVQVKVLEGGSMKRIAHLTPEKDFVNIQISIHPEAIVLNGSYEAMRLEGIGVFIPAIPPREVRHIHDLRAMMDSGLMDDWKITRKGFQIIFMPSMELLTDFPKAKEVIFILQPSEEDGEALEIALADFKEAGRARKETFKHVVLSLGRRPAFPESEPTPEIISSEQADA